MDLRVHYFCDDCTHRLFFIFSLLVHSSLGYRDAVKCVYERKLLEARTEAQQDPQYFLHGVLVKVFFRMCFVFFRCVLKCVRYLLKLLGWNFNNVISLIHEKLVCLLHLI